MTLRVVVASTAHDVADARIHRIARALTRRGAAVEVRGVGDARRGPPATTVHAQARGGVLARLRRAASLLTVRGDVLVVVDPEAAPVGLAWRALRGGRLVADVHEDYAAVAHDRDWLPAGLRWLATAAARASTWAAGRADVTSVADHHVPPLDAPSRIVVTNRPARDELPPPAERDPRPRLLYVGDLRASRGVVDLIEAVRNAEPWELDLVGAVSDPAVTDALQRLDDEPRGRVRVHGRLPLHEAWALAPGAWAGAAVLHATPAYHDAVPTKLYEYLACGLAVLASDLPRLREVVQTANVGVVVRGPAEAAATLRRWYRDPSDLDQLRGAARAWRTRELAAGTDFDRLAEIILAWPPSSRRAP